MGQRLEHVEFIGIVEDDRRQFGPIDFAVDSTTGHCLATASAAATTGPEHLVTDQVGVDHLQTAASQEPPHRALPGTDAAAEKDPDPLAHRRGL